jgi:glucose/arabinose dehydrogenase
MTNPPREKFNTMANSCANRISAMARPLIAVLALSIQSCSMAGEVAPGTDRIKLPEGFRLEVFADDVPNARSMALGLTTLFVGSRTEGKVFAIPLEDTESGPRAAPAITLARGLNLPNGVAFRDGDLYVAAVNQLIRFENVESQLEDPSPQVIYDDYPKATHHGWRYLAFGPDGMLYVPIGAPCNVCDEPGYGVITRINPDGSGRENFVFGIRNSVGFTWHPDTGDMWFTDNGRDWLGDDQPSGELNVATEAGMDFGFPFCHGGDIIDPDFGAGRSCDEFTPPVLQMGAHVAPLGLRFYSGGMFPESFNGQLFVALHGSWNRSEPVGYKVMRVSLDGNTPVDYEPFAEGWLEDGEAWGRPVDIIFLADGSMLISDDRAGVIYRVTYDI